MAPAPSSLPNPDIYLNHFTPSQAERFEFNRNIYLAILGAAIWDFLVYVPDDIKILRRGIGLISLSFVFARVFTITYLMLSVLFYTHPIAHCQPMHLSTAISNGLGAAFTALLFVRRVQAIYAENKVIHWVFFSLWLIYIGTLVAVPFGLHGHHKSLTNYCVGDDRKPYIVGSKFMVVIFDSLVFFTVSYKIAVSASDIQGTRLSWQMVFSGGALSRLSRAVLQGGQQYYLLMVTVNLGNLIVLYIPRAVAYRSMFTPLSSALSASMASRVYRNIKLFEDRNGSMTRPAISIMNFAKSTAPGEKSAELGPGEDRGQVHLATASRGQSGASTGGIELRSESPRPTTGSGSS